MLQSSGSCLPDMRNNPYIECHGRGTCWYYATQVTFWLSTINEQNQFETPVSETLKGQDKVNRASRCSVCIKQTSTTSPNEP